MEIGTRPSEEKDHAALMELCNKIWNTTNSPVSEFKWETIEEYAEYNPPGSQIVAEAGGQVCGFIGMRSPSNKPAHEHVVVIDIAIDPGYQKLGIGRKLLDAAYEQAKRDNKHKLSLRVLATNESAIGFYLKCGYEIQGRLVDEFYLDGRYVDDILMYKRIER